MAGASDNDPTTVASLAVIGSSTVYGLSWLVILVIPMLVVVQFISAAVGAVTQTNLQRIISSRFGRGWGLSMLLVVLAVNVFTLAADLEGGAAALSLLSGRPYQWFLLPLGAGVAALLVWGSYQQLQRLLRYVLLVFATYVGTALLAHPNWHDVLRSTFIPHFTFTPAYVAGALALLGTTLTSYAYIWETIEEAEEKPPLRRLGLVQVDAGLGMVFAGAIFWFILVGTGATLGVGHHAVQTAQDAAKALEPVAGPYAALVFAVGLLASAVLALPVLAGTSAYVLADVLGWRAGLNRPFSRARPFYTTLLLCLLAAIIVGYAGVSPIRLLFISSIAGGLGTPLTLALMMLAARDWRVMGPHRVGLRLAIGGWAVTGIVTAASVIFIWQSALGH